MTNVHIRYEGETKAKFLADVPFDQLDTVIPTIKGWGIEDDPEMFGQFVVNETDAYFEAVVVPAH